MKKLDAKRLRGWAATGAVLAAGLLAAYPPSRLAAQDSLPVGYGTLKRDDIAVRFATGQVEIQILPLEEQVIRLLATDTYTSLRDLIKTKRGDIDDQAQRAGVRHPTLMLVTFFGDVPQARFIPEDVNLVSRGRLFRPAGIVPLSPVWGSQQLEAHQQAVAIYLFEEGISFREQLTVSYEGLSSDSWSRAARLLDQERARVLARAQVKQNP